MTGGGWGFCSPWGIGAALRRYGLPRWIGYGYPYPGAGLLTPAVSREEELSFLKQQAQVIRGQLEEIESRIEELSK